MGGSVIHDSGLGPRFRGARVRAKAKFFGGAILRDVSGVKKNFAARAKKLGLGLGHAGKIFSASRFYAAFQP